MKYIKNKFLNMGAEKLIKFGFIMAAKSNVPEIRCMNTILKNQPFPVAAR
jgi:hypothetical protein